MLSELRVSQLGVIEDLSLVFGPGMTALTGETGAGKTLVVSALELLMGGKADAVLVRPGAGEAVVEARFTGSDIGDVGDLANGRIPAQGEVVLSRELPADGRSRAYIDGRMATVRALAEVGEGLVDLHGQHANQSLFSPLAQREALDAWAGTVAERAVRDAARSKVRHLADALARAGAAEGAQREGDLLRYQLAELEAATISGADEDQHLAAEEERLAMATANKAAAASAYEALAGEDQLLDKLGQVLHVLAGRQPLADLHGRLRGLVAELADLAGDVRVAAEEMDEDPGRLSDVVARRALLRDLCRKYAGPSGGLAEVLVFWSRAQLRLAEIEEQSGDVARTEAGHKAAVAELRTASAALGSARRAAAGQFASAVEARLRSLAMPRARFAVAIAEGRGLSGPDGGTGREGGEGPAALRALAGDDVTFLLAANPGEPLLPLSKVASGGELARAMLALRLVLLDKQGAGPATLVFDEVDAGIGGEAALSVGEALAELASRYQVIVVTHLPQVAAFADAQVVVEKLERSGRSVTSARPVSGRDRVVELSRMMSGQPESSSAHAHAEELLRYAGRGLAGTAPLAKTAWRRSWRSISS